MTKAAKNNTKLRVRNISEKVPYVFLILSLPVAILGVYFYYTGTQKLLGFSAILLSIFFFQIGLLPLGKREQNVVKIGDDIKKNEKLDLGVVNFEEMINLKISLNEGLSGNVFVRIGRENNVVIESQKDSNANIFFYHTVQELELFLKYSNSRNNDRKNDKLT